MRVISTAQLHNVMKWQFDLRHRHEEDIEKELKKIMEIFDITNIDPKYRSITILMKDIKLRGRRNYFLPPIKLIIQFGSCNGGVPRVTAYNNPEIGKSRGSYPAFHPHINADGDICYGEFSGQLAKAVYERYPLTYLLLLKQCLNTWYLQSSYWDINAAFHPRSYSIYGVPSMGARQQSINRVNMPALDYMYWCHIFGVKQRERMNHNIIAYYYSKGKTLKDSFIKLRLLTHIFRSASDRDDFRSFSDRYISLKKRSDSYIYDSNQYGEYHTIALNNFKNVTYALQKGLPRSLKEDSFFGPMYLTKRLDNPDIAYRYQIEDNDVMKMKVSIMKSSLNLKSTDIGKRLKLQEKWKNFCYNREHKIIDKYSSVMDALKQECDEMRYFTYYRNYRKYLNLQKEAINEARDYTKNVPKDRLLSKYIPEEGVEWTSMVLDQSRQED